MKKMNTKNRKGKLKRAHVIPVLLEQVDTNLAATLDMPLLHRRVAHDNIHAENLIKLKLYCSSFVSPGEKPKSAFTCTWKELLHSCLYE
jgi:hypothetical protein